MESRLQTIMGYVESRTPTIPLKKPPAFVPQASIQQLHVNRSPLSHVTHSTGTVISPLASPESRWRHGSNGVGQAGATSPVSGNSPYYDRRKAFQNTGHGSSEVPAQCHDIAIVSSLPGHSWARSGKLAFPAGRHAGGE